MAPFRSLVLTLSLLPLLAGAAPRIVLDPGHGGAQEGALGPDGWFEKQLCLDVAKRVKEQLERSLHASVTLTRERDVLLPLADRVALANRQKPDLFISIHANSMPTRHLRERTQGIETFFLSANATGADASSTVDRENGEGGRVSRASGGDTLGFILADLARAEAHADSSRLAYAVHGKLLEGLHAEDRGVQQAPFYVLMGVDAPAILVEVGFISHPEESRRLHDVRYQEHMARLISDGVASFLQQLAARDHPLASSLTARVSR